MKTLILKIIRRERERERSMPEFWKECVGQHLQHEASAAQPSNFEFTAWRTSLHMIIDRQLHYYFYELNKILIPLIGVMWMRKNGCRWACRSWFDGIDGIDENGLFHIRWRPVQRRNWNEKEISRKKITIETTALIHWLHI